MHEYEPVSRAEDQQTGSSLLRGPAGRRLQPGSSPYEKHWRALESGVQQVRLMWSPKECLISWSLYLLSNIVHLTSYSKTVQEHHSQTWFTVYKCSASMLSVLLLAIFLVACFMLSLHPLRMNDSYSYYT